RVKNSPGSTFASFCHVIGRSDRSFVVRSSDGAMSVGRVASTMVSDLQFRLLARSGGVSSTLGARVATGRLTPRRIRRQVGRWDYPECNRSSLGAWGLVPQREMAR